jgi:hypothetical protein
MDHVLDLGIKLFIEDIGWDWRGRHIYLKEEKNKNRKKE